MRTIVLSPANRGAGLTSVATGLVHALQRKGLRVAFCKPVGQPADGGHDRSNAYIESLTGFQAPPPIDRREAERLLSLDRDQDLLELISTACEIAGKDADVLVVEGMVPAREATYGTRLNALIAKALDADVVLVVTPHGAEPERVVDATNIAAHAFKTDRPVHVIVNRVNLLAMTTFGHPFEIGDARPLAENFRRAFKNGPLKVVGILPFDPLLAAPRLSDVAAGIGAGSLITGDSGRRVQKVAWIGQGAALALEDMTAGTLAVIPSDRSDLLATGAMASLGGRGLAGVLLAGTAEPERGMLDLCRTVARGFPVYRAKARVPDVMTQLSQLNPEVPVDDAERILAVADAVAESLDADWIASLNRATRAPRLSPPAFRHRLIESARAAKKRIVLPEGTEPRTLKAAAICAQRGIATCVLLGDPDEIHRAAAAADVRILDGMEIINPLQKNEQLAPQLVEWRKHKGMTIGRAQEYLGDTIVTGTCMLKAGEVDGLVSGAVHTTAHTIRPALQLIKAAPGYSLVSSCFFMCLPDQVLVFADCAVNPKPTSEELADIALQSAASAEAFGIEPRVAMLSYSTGTSGAGSDVDLVSKAAEIARARRPDLPLDGPLQYDAATQPDVAKSKAPNSKVAGHATVLIFPDLNSGNVTYKAVQRSANVVSVGPMLQGMAKPVNDLSRGALVDDIVFTIALTAIQATQV